MSEFGRQLMTQTLRVAPQIAFSPYPQLLPSVSPSDMSLFDRRRSHFAPEKELLGKRIVEILRDQIEEDKELAIILILDAGSTVFPIFRQLCTHPTFQFDRSNADRLKIITNNLPGVSDLTNYGRIGERLLARTLFGCRILSGYAHSEYEASLGGQTASDLRQAIDEFRESLQDSTAKRIKVVSVTTGNYVSLTGGILARHRNHRETKSAMLDVGDDVYVLAPLGKLLPYSGQEINDLLGLSKQTGYGNLPTWSEISQHVTMVVTTRRLEYFIQLRPFTLTAYFARVQGEVYDRFEEDHLITIQFDPKDDVRVRTQASILGIERALREYELPHQNMRENLIAKLESEA
jgi:DeoR/GlpR family transcriptional regulator of sugar metabolism